MGPYYVGRITAGHADEVFDPADPDARDALSEAFDAAGGGAAFDTGTD